MRGQIIVAMNRRTFLFGFGSIMSPLGLAACKKQPRLQNVSACLPFTATSQSGKVLNPAEWKTLEAACRRLLPTDKEPGAAEAGVIHYIDNELAYSQLNIFSKEIKAGVNKLDLLS